MAYLRLFRPHRGTQSPRLPDHDFPVMRTSAAPAAPTPHSFRMSMFRHEERFPPTRLSAGCGFRKETIAGMRRNGRDAPTTDFPAAAPFPPDAHKSCTVQAFNAGRFRARSRPAGRWRQSMWEGRTAHAPGVLTDERG